jgi:death on curing protein
VKTPTWIVLADLLVLHEALHVQHGGARGVRDQGLLESALARPLQIFNYDESTDLIRLAAAYTSGIIRNHPFIDGNKRAGFLVGILFLEMNGFRFTAAEELATQAVRGLAAGEIDERSFEAFIRRHVKKAIR